MLTVRELIGVLSEYPLDAGVYAYESTPLVERPFIGLVIVVLPGRAQLGTIDAPERARDVGRG